MAGVGFLGVMLGGLLGGEGWVNWCSVGGMEWNGMGRREWDCEGEMRGGVVKRSLCLCCWYVK